MRVDGFTNEKEARLLELLEQQLKVFAQIRKLAQEQAALIEEEDTETLNKSLDRSGKHIERFKGLHQESDALMQSYAYSLSTGGKKVKAIETASAKLREDIEQCGKLEAQNLAAANAKADGYLKQIDKISTSRKSIGLYAQGGTNSSELFDKKG
jgi:hypothetical protein